MPTIGEKENGIDVIEQEQRQKDDLTFNRVCRTCRQAAKSKFRIGDDEDTESTWECECITNSISLTCGSSSSGAIDQKGTNKAPRQQEELELKMTPEEEQERLDASAKKQSKVDEEKHKRKLETSKKLLDGAVALAWDQGDGFTQQSAKGDNQQFPVKEKEEHDSRSTLHEKDIKKNKSKKCTSKNYSVIRVLETDSPSDGPPCVNADNSFHERNLKEERPTKKTSKEKKKSYQATSEDHDLPHSNYKNPAVLRVDSTDADSQIKIQNAMLPGERLIEHKESHYEQLIGRIQRLENEVSGLQKELSEAKEINSPLEVKIVKLEDKCCSLWGNLKDKEEQYNEVEVKQQLEVDLRTLHVELDTGKDSLFQVEEEHEKAKSQLSLEQSFRIIKDEILTSLLREQEELEMTQKKTNSEVSDSYRTETYLREENHILQDEIAELRVEIDRIQHLNQEKEKKYVEDIQILKEKTHDLQKTIKRNETTLRKTISQHSGELNVLTTQNTMLNSELENEKQSKERLEAEVESYHSRLAAAIHDRDQNEKSKGDLELAFQRARHEWVFLQDKMNLEMSHLKAKNESLSQQLSETESKLNSLQTELHHVREETLREKTLALEQVERNLSQTQGQVKEIELKYQNKMNKHMAKTKSLQEILCRLQSENMLLRQQLENAQTEADAKARTMDMEDRLCEIVKNLQVQSEKQSLMMEKRNKELLSEFDHFKERLHQHENERAERNKELVTELNHLKERLHQCETERAEIDELVTERNHLKERLCQYENERAEIHELVTLHNHLKERLRQCENERAEIDELVTLRNHLRERLRQYENERTAERNKELVTERNHLKERLRQYEKERAEMHELATACNHLKERLRQYENEGAERNKELVTERNHLKERLRQHEKERAEIYELVAERNHLKERLCQYENERVGRE